MPKAASPIRLQSDLMNAASTTGDLANRSAAQQIEYWASIGRRVENALSPDTLLAVSTGLARLVVEPVDGGQLDPDEVFDSLERERTSGALAGAVTPSSLRYQASREFPGRLEQIDKHGNITVGQFEHGVFRATKSP